VGPRWPVPGLERLCRGRKLAERPGYCSTCGLENLLGQQLAKGKWWGKEVHDRLGLVVSPAPAPAPCTLGFHSPIFSSDLGWGTAPPLVSVPRDLPVPREDAALGATYVTLPSLTDEQKEAKSLSMVEHACSPRGRRTSRSRPA
jgi:hypothetical protein